MNLRIKLIREDIRRPRSGSFMDAEYVMHIVKGGSFRFFDKRRSYEIGAGDIVLMPPNTLHALRNVRDIHMIVVHFFDLAHELDVRRFSQVMHLKAGRFDHVWHLAQLMAGSWKMKDAYSEMYSEGLLEAVIAVYLRAEEQDAGHLPSDEKKVNWRLVESAVTFMHRHFRESELSIRDVSLNIQVSYNYFCTMFRAYTNESPRHHLNRIRIEAAKEAMYNDGRNVTETAALCGFASVQYFTKVFKRYEGITPSRWRDRARALGADSISRHGGYNVYDG